MRVQPGKWFRRGAMKRLINGLLVAKKLSGAVACRGQEREAPAARLHHEQRANRTSAGYREAYDKHWRAYQDWSKEALAALRVSGHLPEALVAAMLQSSTIHSEEMIALLRRHHATRPELANQRLARGVSEGGRGGGHPHGAGR